MGNIAYNCRNTCLGSLDGLGDQAHYKSRFYLQRQSFAEGFVVREIQVEEWWSLELST